MRKNAIVRLVSFLLMLSMLAGMTACGNKDSDNTSSDTGGDDSKVNFSTQYLDLELDAYMISRFVVHDDIMYFCCQDEADDEGEYLTYVATANIDGTDYSRLELDFDGDIMDIAVDSEGNLWAICDSGDESYSIGKFDAAGAALQTVDLSSVSEDIGSGYYPAYIQLDGQDNICLACYSENDTVLYLFDKAGQFLFDVQATGFIQGIVTTSEGKIGACIYDTNSTSTSFDMQFVDMDAKALADGRVGLGLPYGLYSGKTCGFYLSDGSDFYGYDVEGDSRVIFNWVDAGMSPDYPLVCELSENRFAVLEGTLNSNSLSYSYKLAIIQESGDNSAKSKTVLTLASLYPDQAIATAVTEFNNSSEDYKIEIKQYFNYTADASDEAMMESLLNLNTDIIAGNTPDIIDLSNLPVELYQARGLLEDLNTYIDDDPDINRDDFNENLLDVMSIDGKLSYVTSGVFILTMVASSDNVGTEPGWTAAEFNALLDEYSEITAPLGSSISNDIFMTYMLYANQNLIDWDTGSCNFESPEFINLLELASRFPSADGLDASAAADSQYQAIADGTQLAALEPIYSVYQLAQYNDAFGGNTNFIGLPVEEGVCHVVEATLRLGIISNGEHKDAAWSFVRMFLDEERQDSTYYIPIRNSSFDKMIESCIAGDNIFSTVFGDYEITQEDGNSLKALVDSANYMASYDNTVIDIVSEEAAAFYAGDKTAEDVAGNIQNRVHTYVNEQR